MLLIAPAFGAGDERSLWSNSAIRTALPATIIVGRHHDDARAVRTDRGLRSVDVRRSIGSRGASTARSGPHR
jgi:hypothetical protein